MYIIVPISSFLAWVTIYLSEKRNVFLQWFVPITRRTKEFFIGLIFSMILCLLTQFLLAQLSSTTWAISNDLSIGKLTFSFLYDLNSVVAEELLFRGIILYFLIKYSQTSIATWVSAAVFGIYHWFTFGVLGNIVAMTLVFIVTGLMGYVFAASYVKTKSIILPIGIHLGWNWMNNTVCSNSPNGVQILEPTQTAPLDTVYQVLSICIYLIIPFLILVFIKSKLISKSDLTEKSIST
jgi:uncharacterized protein